MTSNFRIVDDDALSRPISFIDMSTWDRTPAPPREWAVRERIPLQQPTLLSGEGDVGKTIVELQLCVSHVLGRDWLGSMPEPGPAIYLGAEDTDDELRRRLTDIARHYGTTFADLEANGLYVKSFAGEDMLLGIPDRHGKIEPTPLFESLLVIAREIQPKHIGLDTAADVFGGNENDRTQVRQFVGMLRKLAIVANGSVVLLSHPSLAGINSGSGLSGSTGWHNSVRARAYLTKVEGDDSTSTRDVRQLSFLKNNYGPIADKMIIRWRDGVFVPEPKLGSLEQIAANGKIDNLFLDLLDRFTKQGRTVNDRNGITYAPTLFAHEPDAREAGVRKHALADAMRRLFADNRIHVAPFGRPSRPAFRLVSGPAPKGEV